MAGAWGSSAWAGDGAPISEVRNEDLPLQQVVVTAPAADASSALVLAPGAVREQVPAADGASLLGTVPGFAEVRNGGTNGDPVLRGMFGSRIGLLADGIAPLGACGGRMDNPASYLTPNAYDRVTIVKGPQTVLYGPGASAGVVRFERDTPRFTAPGMRADASLLGGSAGRADQSVDLAAGGALGYGRLLVGHAHSDDYRDGGGRRIPSAWDKWNVDTSLGLKPDARTDLRLDAGTSDGYARYATRGMDGARFRRDSVGLNVERAVSGTSLERVEAKLYYQHADHVMDNVSLRPVPAGGRGMSSNVDRRLLGARLALTLHATPDMVSIVGMDARQDWRRSRGGMGSDYAARPRRLDARMFDTGWFAQTTWHRSPTTRVVGGARLDWAGAEDARVGSVTRGQERTRWLPSGFLRIEADRVLPGTSAYAGIGHVQRFPDYWELFSSARGPDGSVNAFRGVAPEKTTQLDIGVHTRYAAVDAWLSAYAGYVQDFVMFEARGMPRGMRLVQVHNVDARILGGESGLRYALSKHWSVGGTLAYAWASQVGGNRPLPQIPPLDSRLNVQYERARLSGAAVLRLVAPQRRIRPGAGNVIGRDAGPSAGFGVLSVSLSYRLSKTLRLSAGIDNLLDKRYTQHLNLNGLPAFGFAANTPINDPGRFGWLELRMAL